MKNLAFLALALGAFAGSGGEYRLVVNEDRRDHPVFKNLPHDGALDELFFRIVKEGRELPLDGLKKEDLLAVGEGGKACYLYLGQAKVLKGQALLSFGLDVLADTVEGTALLDGMIGYVRSSAFAPTGVCTLPQGNTK